MVRAKLEDILAALHDRMHWETRKDDEYAPVLRAKFSNILLGEFLVESEQTVRTKWNALKNSSFVVDYNEGKQIAYFDIHNVRQYLKKHNATFLTPEDVSESESERAKISEESQ